MKKDISQGSWDFIELYHCRNVRFMQLSKNGANQTIRKWK